VDVGTVSGVPVIYESIRHHAKQKKKAKPPHFKVKRCRKSGPRLHDGCDEGLCDPAYSRAVQTLEHPMEELNCHCCIVYYSKSSILSNH
jgi:hypothetical protein